MNVSGKFCLVVIFSREPRLAKFGLLARRCRAAKKTNPGLTPPVPRPNRHAVVTVPQSQLSPAVTAVTMDDQKEAVHSSCHC